MAQLTLEDISLHFQIRHKHFATLKETVLRRFFGRAAPSASKVVALDQITLTIREGERVGIIGPNGAGKSTLLKVLAGVYPPTAGTLHVEGRISSLFDIFLGFEPDATGWDNIYFRGYLQGETPRSIRSKLQSIAEFSELAQFLDMPVRYYSAGMAVRLAFAIATAVDPEILLIDEVISVGDRSFQPRARKRLDEMMARARLIVMVSHDLTLLQQLCTRIIWMEKGRVRDMGPPQEMIQAYLQETLPSPLGVS